MALAIYGALAVLAAVVDWARGTLGTRPGASGAGLEPAR